MDSNSIKKVSIVIFVIGALSSIIMAVVYGKKTVIDGFGFETVRSAPLTIAILLSCFIGTCLLSLIFYCISNILDYLECIYEKMEEKEDVNAEEIRKQSGFSNSKVNLLDEGGQKGDWECKKCGCKNSVSELICKDCGTYK